MAKNHIEIYQQNTQVIAVWVGGLSDLTLYTPYLTVKKKATDSSTLLSKTGLVSDASTTYTFDLSGTDTSIAPGDYCYDITLESDTLGKHTIIKDKFSILESVRI